IELQSGDYTQHAAPCYQVGLRPSRAIQRHKENEDARAEDHPDHKAGDGIEQGLLTLSSWSGGNLRVVDHLKPELLALNGRRNRQPGLLEHPAEPLDLMLIGVRLPHELAELG